MPAVLQAQAGGIAYQGFVGDFLFGVCFLFFLRGWQIFCLCVLFVVVDCVCC